MSASVLDRTIHAYRIGAANNLYPIFDGTGAMLFPGRWNTARTRLIYCSEHYSTALLEKLVHTNTGTIPSNQQWIEITIPIGTTYEIVTPYSLNGWNHPAQKISKAFGDRWVREKRSAILFVPSIIAPIENNILINEAHPQFSSLTTSLDHPVIWDKRLFFSL
ncbi:MAG: RES domain-containing protein [Hydrococcus sp. Prado102]|jgi:RES domain-containing protein|nr:RES domain-containing protein [Hydrococcus sp. Prado102]